MSGPLSDSTYSVFGELNSGLRFSDQGLADAVRDGLTGVEQLLRDSVQSDFHFATNASLHLVDAGGKRFRPLFTLLAAQFGQPRRDDVVKAAAVVELVHLATLYHDDVMDEATMRRGATSANARWNNSVAILTGDLLFAHASQLGAMLGTEVVRLMAKTFERLVTGQLQESVGPENGTDPVDHYLNVVANKTGSLIATSGRFGAMFADLPEHTIEALTSLGELIGTAFQISDDIIDIASPAAESGKVPGTDLREGVRTLPMLYALSDDDGPYTPRLRELLAGPITDDETVHEALHLLRESTGLTNAMRTLESYADDARTRLLGLPECAARDALSSLVDYVLARTR